MNFRLIVLLYKRNLSLYLSKNYYISVIDKRRRRLEKGALESDPDGIRTHIVRTGILNSIH